MITSPKCGSNYIRVYEEIGNDLIYTVYICIVVGVDLVQLGKDVFNIVINILSK